ncbi:AsmA family protein, partial [Brevundimonas sp.]|uniref:AsmA family protein n=1 Tax=Brevundimonas sp. TaxID=1871086 RepID=UPI0028ABE01A
MIDRPSLKSVRQTLKATTGSAWRGLRGKAEALKAHVVTRDPVWLAVRRPGRPEAVAVGVTAAVAVGLLLLLIFFDGNWLRGPIGRAASASTGREVVLRGDLDVRLLSWTPSATVRDLHVGGPAWARDRNTAEVERLDVSVRLRRLFIGQVEVTSLTMTRPTVRLIVDEQGRRSWDLRPDRPDDGRGAKLPVSHRLVIHEGRLTLDEQRRG